MSVKAGSERALEASGCTNPEDDHRRKADERCQRGVNEANSGDEEQIGIDDGVFKLGRTCPVLDVARRLGEEAKGREGGRGRIREG